MSNLILFNKPFNVLSQFTGETGQTTLAHFLNSPDSRGYYPAGRLDYDSEGLLLLTNNGALQHRISSPRYKLPKTYWVQVEGIISDDALAQLEAGLDLKDGKTRPAEARAMEEPKLWPRTPPIRERKSIPTSWLELTISEGRNRQVRRMTAAVGLPTLRLIRVAIGNWSLNDLAPGEFRFEATQAPAPKPRTNTSHNKRPKFRPGVRNRP